MAEGNTYEEARRQRLQENRKRFEDLGISKTLVEINKSLKNKSPVPASMGQKKPMLAPTYVEPRRSSRARNVVTSYCDDVDIGLPSVRKRSRSYSSSWASSGARPLDEIKVASYEERVKAIKAAEKLQTSLNSENPSFVKSMVRSHVYSCFWLGLPSKFCEEHLPKKSLGVVLEDESGSEYGAIYIGSRSGLSGGWRGFALDHKLDDGDALVFELVEPERFKVYITRAHNLPHEEPNENSEDDRKATTDFRAKKKNRDKERATRNGSALGGKKKRILKEAKPNTGGTRRSTRNKATNEVSNRTAIYIYGCYV